LSQVTFVLWKFVLCRLVPGAKTQQGLTSTNKYHRLLLMQRVGLPLQHPIIVLLCHLCVVSLLLSCLHHCLPIIVLPALSLLHLPIVVLLCPLSIIILLCPLPIVVLLCPLPIIVLPMSSSPHCCLAVPSPYCHLAHVLSTSSPHKHLTQAWIPSDSYNSGLCMKQQREKMNASLQGYR
jgi:hypothetical protein